MKLTLSSRRPEAPDVESFIFKPDAPLVWKAGQYLHYLLDHANPDKRGKERYFSIASAPHEQGIMLTTRFAKKNGSSFKGALKQLKIGDSLQADGLEGDFVMGDAKQRSVFIAGGIGITPFRAILLDLEHRGERMSIDLLYANRDAEFPYKKEFEQLQSRNPGLRIHYFVSPRRIDEEAIRTTIPGFQAASFYVSGPEPMVEAFDKMLKKMGLPEKQIKNDFFPGYEWPEEEPKKN